MAGSLLRMSKAFCAAWGLAALPVLLVVGCSEQKPPAFSFYDDRVAPVLEVGCAQQTTGCHVANMQAQASGNLDLSSFESLMRRKDVLPPTGPYAVGQLLLKGGDPLQVPVQTFDPPDPLQPDQRFIAITTDIRHAGGKVLREGSDGYARVKSWIAQGYHKDGSSQEAVHESVGDCRPGPGVQRGFDPDVAPTDQTAFSDFVLHVQPVLLQRCAGSSCHGSPIADLHLSCGSNDAESRWNYFVALSHVDVTSSLSELLRRPLAKQRGGTFHEGGTIFASTDDPGYVAIRTWIDGVLARDPQAPRYLPDDEGERFFGNYVQPMLVKKGCMLGNCHSRAMFHELPLRTGSLGVFSRIAMDKNYDMAKLLLNVEAADPNQSRIIAKNLFPPDKGGRGISHRGGALFEDFGTPARADSCAGIDVTKTPLDQASAYCVFVAWHALERKLASGRGEIETDAELSLVYVSRPLGVGDARDFDSYRPGADLLRAPLTLQGDKAPTLGTGTTLLSGCGLVSASADIRGVAVSWDAKRIAFGVRSAADQPLRLYEANADGTGCAPIAGLAAAAATVNGILTHDFDPAYAPDGRLVFASTRGNLVYGEGPTRTPSQLKPNANLYVFDRGAGSVRELTFLSNQEVEPSFMADGRLIFSTEKRAPQFFQLAGRRMNLDGGDYHPLFAQRASVGFESATEIIELPDRNLAFVAAKFGAVEGAGTIAIVNRSLGPDQDDRDPNDKLFLHALRFPAPGAFGGGAGAFRSPVRLPSRWLLASCDPSARDLTVGNFDFDLCALDPATGEVARLGGVAGRAELDGVAIYPRQNHGVFVSKIDESNGRSQIVAGSNTAEVHVLDLPLLSTLLFSNTRTGRPIDPNVAGFEIFTSVAPPADAQSFDALPAEHVVADAFGRVWDDRQSLGKVKAQDDGSARFLLPGGRPITLGVIGSGGALLPFPVGSAFMGDQIQREEMQFYPGEHTSQGFRRGLFNGLCGGCHGSVSGQELDVAIDVDVLTKASTTLSSFMAPQLGAH
ncbi:MAG: hypothetical protein JWN48_5808 [Myxococcaceae bacterium]|nr:hypothetical protein [Myxococcaceae bacterium]